MEIQDVNIFISNLNLKLNVFCFDYLASIPLPFSDLGKVNRVKDVSVSDKYEYRSLHLPAGYGKPLKEFLKPFKRKESMKRKPKNSGCQGISNKFMKTDTHHTEVTDELLTSTVEEKTKESDQEEGVDYINLDGQKMKKALKHFNSFIEDENLNRLKKVLLQSRDEGELEIGLGIHLFSKMMGNAFTSRTKSVRNCPCGCQEKLLHSENMWIGSDKTWYGELDIIAGNPASEDAVSVLVKSSNHTGSGDTEIQTDDCRSSKREEAREEESEEDESEEEDSSEFGDSPGDRTLLSQALNQVIAQAVVFAFTEFNRHTNKGQFIPSILIEKSYFQYAIYSPVDDILLVSNRMMFSNEENFDIKTGYRPFVVLWIILNHRFFFKKCPDFRRRAIESGFRKNIVDLQQFQDLKDYSKCIRIKQNLHFPNDTPNAIGSAAMEWFLNN